MTKATALGSIVVGVDGSASDRRALDWAIDQAERERRSITLLHAVSPQGWVWVDQAGAETRVGLHDPQTGPQRLLAEARSHVARRAPHLEVHEVLRVADARDVLHELSREAAIVVIGSRGRGPMRTLLLRSVGVAVTRYAECPVVVVRPGNEGLVGDGVLVSADGSEHSHGTVEFAYRQASLWGMPLTVLHCPDESVVDRAAAEEARLLLAESLAGLAEKFPDVHVHNLEAHGLADARLVWMAERMDLVVIGSHDEPGSETIFGSVVMSVVEHATCAVAVVPVPSS